MTVEVKAAKVLVQLLANDSSQRDEMSRWGSIVDETLVAGNLMFHANKKIIAFACVFLGCNLSVQQRQIEKTEPKGSAHSLLRTQPCLRFRFVALQITGQYLFNHTLHVG